jgi:hypothetical protein
MRTMIHKSKTNKVNKMKVEQIFRCSLNIILNISKKGKGRLVLNNQQLVIQHR